MLLRAVPGALAALGLSRCGYALAGRGAFLPQDIRTVGIPTFGNSTPYFTIEQIFTEKVRVAFQSRGQYVISPSDTGVDGLVRGTITGVAASPAAFTNQQQASRYRFTVTVALAFIDARAKQTLWENPALSFSDEYDLASQGGVGLQTSAFLDQERAAIDRLSTDFARAVVSAILEAF